MGFMLLKVVPGTEHGVTIGVENEENAYNLYLSYLYTKDTKNDSYS